MRVQPGAIRRVVTSVAAAAALSGCSGVAPDHVERHVVPVAVGGAMDVGRAHEELAALRVRAETNSTRYRRADYGPRWADVEASGCNQRDDLLYARSERGNLRVQRQGTCPHDVLAGAWTDPYTGDRVVLDDLKDQRQAMAITIDHLVSLREAHRSGGDRWPALRKLRFANDLANLEAVAGSTNAAKGDRDPSRWLPPVTAARCGYAGRWVAVKSSWGLAVDVEERRVLLVVLAACQP